MDIGVADSATSAARYTKLTRAVLALGTLLAAMLTTFTGGLVLLSLTQPALVVRVMDQGTVGALLRVVVVFVASGLAHLLHYL